MKINIKPYHFTELLGKGISLDMVYMLELVHNGNDLAPLYKENIKVENLRSSLVRKGLILEKEDKLTSDGNEIISFIYTRGKVLKKKPANAGFDKWWAAYPKTGDFEYKGMKFEGDRSYRVKKDDCRSKYEKIIDEGYTDAEMEEAIKLQVHRMKESSVRERRNKLRYLQNSFTYLHQRSFESFVDLVRSGVRVVKEEETRVEGSTNI